MEQFLTTETLIIELMLIASLVAIAVRRLRIPYTVALVVVGLLLTFQNPLDFELTPELILTLFVPPLVFEAAFHLNFALLRRNLSGILLLAIPGVLLTTLIVAGILVFGASISLPLALVFGALIAATDPVAVVALFRSLGVPRRLAVMIEGESLLNDGTAIVLFNLLLAFALTGKFDLIDSMLGFLRVSVGGTVVGLILGMIAARLISRIDDYLIETTLTTVLAFGSYLVAEQLHFSGVLAVVAAGLVNGNIGPEGMSPTTRIVLFNFWEYVAFLANSMVFLLLGLEVNIPAILANLQPILWAVLAVLGARVLVVYGLGGLVNRYSEPIPKNWLHVLSWGGLRGAISLALALSLPIGIGPERDLLRTMAFGVVLFTLLVQSTTMVPLLRKLRIMIRSEAQVEYEKRHARLVSLQSAVKHLERRFGEGLLTSHTWEILKTSFTRQINQLSQDLREVMRADPMLEAEELDTAYREVQRARRTALQGLRQDGVISDEVFEELSAEVDLSLTKDGYAAPINDLLRAAGSEEVRLSLANYSGLNIEEVTIEAGTACDGKSVREIAWPEGSVIASVHRGRQVIVPRGSTVLHAGDILVVVLHGETGKQVKEICQTAAKDIGQDGLAGGGTIERR
jgi:CPA1 family monovalent cation:H+ antiporter